jgi:hypothetical protein
MWVQEKGSRSRDVGTPKSLTETDPAIFTLC